MGRTENEREGDRPMNSTTLSPSATAMCADGKISDGTATVSLAYNRPDRFYHGPVWQWCGALWILYQNRPVPVCHSTGNQYDEIS